MNAGGDPCRTPPLRVADSQPGGFCRRARDRGQDPVDCTVVAAQARKRPRAKAAGDPLAS